VSPNPDYDPQALRHARPYQRPQERRFWGP
jgi:hypothetical protein